MVSDLESLMKVGRKITSVFFREIAWLDRMDIMGGRDHKKWG